jgi:hypothetical protein
MRCTEGIVVGHQSQRTREQLLGGLGNVLAKEWHKEQRRIRKSQLTVWREKKIAAVWVADPLG